MNLDQPITITGIRSDGHYITARAPYGYRYVPRRAAMPGHIMVDEPEAELVRRVYGWFTDEQTTIRQVVKRLNASPDRPRSGRPAWAPATIHHMLADPIYTGTAYANRYASVAPAKPSIQRGPRTAAATRRCFKPREQWIAIPVPALVDQGTWDQAQAQLARNAALSFRNNTRHSYLLRCLLKCELCGLAMYGITRPASAQKPAQQIYRCHGKDCVVMARTSICPSRHLNAEEIEPVVWNHVMALLADPDQLLAQFDRFATAANGVTARHGVSAPSGVQAGFHPPRYAALLKPSSPILRHSSLRQPRNRGPSRKPLGFRRGRHGRQEHRRVGVFDTAGLLDA